MPRSAAITEIQERRDWDLLIVRYHPALSPLRALVGLLPLLSHIFIAMFLQTACVSGRQDMQDVVTAREAME